MKNSVPIHNRFYFNTVKQIQVEGAKYIEALKSISWKVVELLQINNTYLTGQEFWDIVSSAKLCQNVAFQYDLIAFDEKCDFDNETNDCNISHLHLNYSGSLNYSNWNQIPQRFENLIAAIARWDPLKNSLGYIRISHWDMKRDVAEEVLKKYNLIKITINI